jgi:hypothetical protein
VERTCLTSDGGAIFTVDLARREVLIASMPGLAPEQRPAKAVDHAQAMQIARNFAAGRISGFQQLALIRDSLDDHGAAGGQHYMFLWAPRPGSHGAVGLPRVSVSVDAATGAIVSFMHIPSGPLAVDAEPTVSRDQALAIAQRHFGAPVKTSTASLDVWWKNNDRTQPQVLRWHVVLESDEPVHPEAVGERFIPKRAAYYIDAHTGEVLETMR